MPEKVDGIATRIKAITICLHTLVEMPEKADGIMALSAWKFQLPAAASILKTASGGLLVEDRSKGKVAGVGRFLFQMKEILK